MGRVKYRRATFADRLRVELDQRQLSVRGLAKRLDPIDLERGRRNLNRWLSGKYLPSRTSRVALAEALGVERETFLDDEDEEEDPLVAATTDDLFRALLAKVNRATA